MPGHSVSMILGRSVQPFETSPGGSRQSDSPPTRGGRGLVFASFRPVAINLVHHPDESEGVWRHQEGPSLRQKDSFTGPTLRDGKEYGPVQRAIVKLSTASTALRLPLRKPSRSTDTNLNPNDLSFSTTSPRKPGSKSRGKASSATSIRATSPLW